MAAIRDPETGHVAPPAMPAEARLLLPRDPARATAVLYRKYSTTVYRFTWHMLGSREDAEDATQATFLSVHSALQSGTAIREPQAWVLKIARNECLARITQRMRRPLMDSLDDDTTVQVAGVGPSVSQSVEMRGDLDAASGALARLPTSQREAFVLREWVGLSTSEIAVSLGTTVSAVDALLNRARRELIRVVGGAEGAAGCGETRAALSDGILDRAARAHLIRCKACRSLRRNLSPQLVAARAIVPPAAIAARLADALPGFASSAGSAAAGGGAAVAGGGGIAALVAKVASAPAVLKGAAAALATAVAVGGGVAAENARHTHNIRTAVDQKASVAALPVSIIPIGAPNTPRPGGLATALRVGALAPGTVKRSNDGAPGASDTSGSSDHTGTPGTVRSGGEGEAAGTAGGADSRHETSGTGTGTSHDGSGDGQAGGSDRTGSTSRSTTRHHRTSTGGTTSHRTRTTTHDGSGSTERSGGSDSSSQDGSGIGHVQLG